MRTAAPAAMAVACPLLLTVVTEVFDEVQVTCWVISRVDPSEFVPMATNCWVTPTGMDGITVMEDRVAEVTVRVVLPEIVSKVAVMLAVPAAKAVASPLLLIVAAAGLDEVQVTWVVISWLVPSEYVPRAINCRVAPTGMLRSVGKEENSKGKGFGVTAMEDRVAGVTVRVVLPEILPEVAVMVAVPAVRAVARPLLLTVASEVLDEVQVTWVVISWLVPSE
jgi:hypothetical protein